ncbi:MAG: FkbM family methyltransferase [Ferruginibacter sp.]
MSTILLWIAKGINRLFSRGFQRKGYFDAWRYIYRLGLTGMGRIQGNPIDNNGELDVMRLISQKQKKDLVVFDVGANVGQYTTHLLQTCSGRSVNIHLFEPSSANGEQLNRVFIKKQSDQVRIHINVMALGDEDKEAYLFADVPGSDLASLHDLRTPIRPFDEDAREWVRVSTLDSYCRQTGIEQIDLLKIDVEGAEFQVLKGAESMIRQGNIDAIQFEFGAGNITSRIFFRDFWELLSDQYDFHQVVMGGLIPIPAYSNEWEIFRTTNYLLLRK